MDGIVPEACQDGVGGWQEQHLHTCTHRHMQCHTHTPTPTHTGCTYIHRDCIIHLWQQVSNDTYVGNLATSTWSWDRVWNGGHSWLTGQSCGIGRCDSLILSVASHVQMLSSVTHSACNSTYSSLCGTLLCKLVPTPTEILSITGAALGLSML